jgi:glycerophosphoryl diester phosphodiesterase
VQGAVDAGMSAAHSLMALTRPLVIAHRGYSQLAPENTLAAFRMGVLAGADLVELDYFVSRDEVAVVIHDATLDRTTDAVARWGETGIRVDSKPAAVLQTLDVGSWFDPAFRGERLPLLTEALDTIQGGGGVTLLERKEGSAEQMAALLEARQLINAVVVQAFDWKFVATLHGLLPDQVLGALGPPREKDGRRLTREERRLTPKFVDEAKATGARVIGWNNQVDAAAVAYAHAAGLKVWIYTINDADQARALLAMGVDGIITDNTSLIWRVLAER